MHRDGNGPWGGHVLSVRFYETDADQMYHADRDLTGTAVTDGRWVPRLPGNPAVYVFTSYRAGRTDLWADAFGIGMAQRTFVNGRWGAWHRLPYGN